MKPGTISLRRRHLMMAGLAGAAAPAPLFAGPGGKPLAGAEVEVRHAGASGKFASAITDGDGRFFATIAAADSSGRPRRIHYCVRHEGHETPVTHRISDDLVANLRRDDAGVWRTTFGLTLA